MSDPIRRAGFFRDLVERWPCRFTVWLLNRELDRVDRFLADAFKAIALFSREAMCPRQSMYQGGYQNALGIMPAGIQVTASMMGLLQGGGIGGAQQATIDSLLNSALGYRR